MVLGGVVAGSAAAWLLSTAGAHAASPDGDELKHAAERLSTLPEQAVDAVHGTVRKVGETLHGEKPAKPGKPAEWPQSPDRDDVPPAPAEDAVQPGAALLDLGSLLSGMLGGGSGELPNPPAAEPPACAPEFEDWCERVADWFTPPQPGELVPTLPGDVTVPPADGGADLPAALPSPAHGVVAKPAVAVEPIEQDAANAAERVDSGLGSRGHPLHKNLPGKHTPLGVPGPPAATAPGSGTALAGHADGSPMAITAASAAAAAGGATTASRSIIPGSCRPGGQPGVTPD